MNLVATPAYLSTAIATFEADFKAKLHWSEAADDAIEQRVASILADVQKRGDAAVLEYTARFDGLTANSVRDLELTQADFKTAFDGLPASQRDALQAAARRRLRFCRLSKPTQVGLEPQAPAPGGASLARGGPSRRLCHKATAKPR